MTTAIERAIAPVALPVTLAEAKAHLRVDSAAEDDLISALVDAAVSHLDGLGVLGRAMITQSWAQWFSQVPGRPRLLMGPFQSLTSVEYFDADNVLQTATLSDFETWRDGDFVILKPKENFEWPNAFIRPDAIKVTYVAGYGDDAADVPQSVRQAILLLVGHWYENRMATTEANMREMPFAVESLIGLERVGWYG